GDPAARLDTEAVGVAQHGTPGQIASRAGGARQRLVAFQAERLAGVALPARPEDRPLRLGRRREAVAVEHFQRAALAARAPRQVPGAASAQLDRDDAVLEGIPAQDLQDLLELLAVRPEGSLAKLPGE